VFRIALKGIRARKWRLISTGVAIILGVAFISGTSVLGGMLNRSVSSLFDDAFRGIDGVIRSAEAQEAPASTQPIREPIDASVLELARATKGVKSAQGVIRVTASMLDKKGKRLSAFGPPVYAVNWTDDADLPSGVVSEGRPPQGPDEVVMDFKTAEEFGFRVGDTVTVQLPKGGTESRLVGIGGLGSDGRKPTPTRIVLFETKFLQELTGIGDRYDYVSLAAESGTTQRQLADSVGAVIPQGLEVKTGEEFTKETQGELSRIFDNITSFISAFGYIAAFVGAFVIYNTFSILVAQRSKEMALLRAVGASRRQILGSVLVEALITGLVAAGIGLFAGYFLAIGLQSALGGLIPLGDTSAQLTTGAVVQSLLVGVLVTMVAALVPAYRATRVAPVAAMSESAVESSSVGRSRLAFGALFVVVGITLVVLGAQQVVGNVLAAIGAGAALLFLSLAILGPLFAGRVVGFMGRPLRSWFGVTGELARQNAIRNPKRTTATAVALTIGVGLVTIIAVLAASLKGSVTDSFSTQLRAELIVDSGGFGTGGFSRDVRTQIEEVPGVRTVASIRFNAGRALNSAAAEELAKRPADVQLADPQGDGRPLSGPSGEGEQSVIGVDPGSYFDIADLGTITPGIEALRDDTVMVAESLMEKNGWKIGDNVEMWFAQGGTVEWPIVATYSLGFGPGGFLITNPTFDKYAPPVLQTDLFLYVRTAEGANVAQVKDDIARTIEATAPAASVQNISEFIKEITGQLDTALNFIYVLLALAIIVALVGIWNTLRLSILERTRELGLLRAVGMDRSQVRRATRWESAVIALFGTVLGIIMGVALGILLVGGFSDPPLTLTLPLWDLALITVLGSFAGVLAAIVPAYSAARLDILDAISTN